MTGLTPVEATKRSIAIVDAVVGHHVSVKGVQAKFLAALEGTDRVEATRISLEVIEYLAAAVQSRGQMKPEEVDHFLNMVEGEVGWRELRPFEYDEKLGV